MSETDAPIAPQLPPSDLLFDELLGLCAGGLSLAITVVADGAVLSGKLVPLHTYLAALAETFARAGSGNNAAEYEALLPKARLLFDVDDATAAAERESQGERLPNRFLHLVDARVLAGPGGMAPTRGPGPAMRVQASAVSAWWLGAMTSG